MRLSTNAVLRTILGTGQLHGFVVIPITFVVFAVASMRFVVPVLAGDVHQRPPQTGDGPDYDCLAVQLSKGNGFRFDWSDADYRSPYLEADQTGQFDALLRRTGGSYTTYRPPLLPFAMSIAYRIGGRDFAAVRAMNATSMAAAAAVVFYSVASRFGIVAGFVPTLWMVLFGYRIQYYSHHILTEAFACFAVAVICELMLRFGETRNIRWATSLGLVFALAFFVRSAFVLWVPVVAAAILVLSKTQGQKWRSRETLKPPVIFVSVFLLVACPWMIRNCLVLEAVKPLGTMGATQLAAGYGDTAWEHRGEWVSPSQSGVFGQIDFASLTSVEAELARADASTHAAIQWVRDNPIKTLALPFFKVAGMWTPWNGHEKLLMVFSVVGLLVLISRQRSAALSVIALIVAGTLSVGATWTVGGRFLIPLFPVLYFLCGVALWGVLSAAVRIVTARFQEPSMPLELEKVTER